MRVRFDEQLLKLNDELTEMGAMIETAIDEACRALIDQDLELALATMHADEAIDRKEREIETLCLKMLLMQQPVARDLRSISSALKMITDMERIGDHAQDISEIVTMMARGDQFKKPDHIRQMADEARDMLNHSIDAFVRRDVTLARSVIAQDDVVDDLFTAVKRELTELLRTEAESGATALDLLMIAKYFERIGDHAVNIAEWVEYSVTGYYKGELL